MANVKDEALKRAIGFAETSSLISGELYYQYRDVVLSACKEALQQPAWQGLTDDEVGDLITPYEYSVHPDLDGLTRAIEQALKEKNNGN